MPRAHKTPSAMISTAEEDQFFAKDKAASRAAETEEAQDETEEQRGAAGEAEQPEEEGAPETEGEPGAGDQEAEPAGADAEEAPGRTVPIGEVYAEREKRKAAEALQKQQAERISQLEETFRKVVDRIGGLQQPQQAPVQPDIKIPSYEEDPLAHLKATQELLARQIGGTSQWTQQQQLEQQLQAHIYASENEFRSTHPDYDAAAAYAQNLRVRELSLLTNDPVQVTNALRQDIFSIAARAHQTGRNPAELYYEYAKLRGYQPQQEQTTQPQQQKPQSGNGAQRLKQIAAAQAVSKAPKGGTAPQAAVTLTDLSTMSDDEFDKNFDRFWKQT